MEAMGTTDQLGIIARAVTGLQTTNEQGLSEMTKLGELTMLLSPYPNNAPFDTPGEIWANVFITIMASMLMVICICRMNVLTDRHKLIVRIRYVILFCGAMSTAMAPWAFPNNPRMGGMLLVAALLFHLLMSAAEWKDGAPPHMISWWGALCIDDERKCDDLYCAQCAAMGRDPNSVRCRCERIIRMVAYILRGDRPRHLQRGDGGAP